MINPSLELEYIGRIAGAAVLGGVIGLEREVHGQAAGLRTHMIVALGSALMMIVSIRMGDAYGGDRGRIAAQVVTGIGFLGAGAIMRLGTNVRGLTTAACIWTAAGIGLAIGEGWYIGAVAATILAFIVIYVFNFLEKSLIGGRHTRRIVFKSREHPGVVAEVTKFLEAHDIQVKELSLAKDVTAKKVTVTVLSACPDRTDYDGLSRDLSSLPDVESVEVG